MLESVSLASGLHNSEHSLCLPRDGGAPYSQVRGKSALSVSDERGSNRWAPNVSTHLVQCGTS